ncbi:hypothetical protein LMG26690_01332 [Achromobacter animicus]|uniref:Uncharacterized protein n=1 Tax=Achromobacter animicus TaxID=1389935 RepID=A0A6S6ZII3_9BURK|nr:hypothetical protein [Achromobacter animicus]CAB3676057.1 hypothetical protein LMG26690_01332 [Achromobacter animicus]
MHTIRFTEKTQPSLAARFGQGMMPADSHVDRLFANLADPEGRPFFDYMISPSMALLGPGGVGVRDRRQRDLRWLTTGSGVLSTSAGRFVLPGTFLLSAGSAAAANPSAFTLVCRAKLIGTGGALVGSQNASITGTGAVTLGPSGVLTAAGGASNVADNAGSLVGVDLVVTVTFSTERGVQIRRNGVQTYVNAGRTAANAGSQLKIGGTGTVSSRFNGEIGYWFYSLRDLSDPRLLSGLEAIERELIAMG